MTTINVTQTTLNLSVKAITIIRTIIPATTTLNVAPNKVGFNLNYFIKPTTIKFYGKKINITLTSINTTPLASANSSLGLNLDNVPQVEDQSIYQALLQIHSALDVLIEAINDLRLNKVDK